MNIKFPALDSRGLSRDFPKRLDVKLDLFHQYKAGIVFVPDLAEFFQRAEAHGEIKSASFGVTGVGAEELE
ncbi:MAG: hypothetical protein R6W69_01285, partial [Anaerolineales bacterium]